MSDNEARLMRELDACQTQAGEHLRVALELLEYIIAKDLNTDDLDIPALYWRLAAQ